MGAPDPRPDQLRVRNWDRWQSYRRDRGQPPWIKVHRAIMRNVEWVSLTDAQRGQLVAIWLLAADQDGVIPASPAVIRKLCFLDSEPDLNVFIRLGFLDGDATVTPTWRQHVAPETETETETEAETEGEAEGGVGGKRRAARSATRLPPDFLLTTLREAYARQYGLDPSRTMENFTDYWNAAAGAKARKQDWDACWRTWCRRESEINAKEQRKHGKPTFDELQQQLRRQAEAPG